MVLGARLMGSADDTVEVWAARTELVPGQPLTADDLQARRVRFADPDDERRYLKVGADLPTDATLSRAVGRGELVPATALGDPDSAVVEVPLSLAGDDIPNRLRAGDTVDVYLLSEPGAKTTGDRIFDDVAVRAIPAADDTFGASGERQVLVAVPEDQADDIGRVLAAARDDRISLTRQG